MKNRPKKSNPRARKPRSRHAKIECPECGKLFSESSLAGHLAISHSDSYNNKEKDTHVQHQHKA